jgi:hypothetical protein
MKIHTTSPITTARRPMRKYEEAGELLLRVRPPLVCTAMKHSRIDIVSLRLSLRNGRAVVGCSR